MQAGLGGGEHAQNYIDIRQWSDPALLLLVVDDHHLLVHSLHTEHFVLFITDKFEIGSRVFKIFCPCLALALRKLLKTQSNTYCPDSKKQKR